MMANTSFIVEDDESLQLEVRRAQLDVIYAQNVNAYLGQPLSAFVCAVLIRNAVPTDKLLIWLGIFIVVQSLRYIHLQQFNSQASPLNSEQLTYWSRAHIFFTFLTALSWSIGALYLWPATAIYQFIFLSVIIFTVAAAMIGHSSHKLSYLIYALVSTIPVCLQLIAEGSGDQVAFGIANLIGLAMLIRIAQRNNASSVQAFWIGIKYREQAKILAQEKSRIEALNQQLVQQTQSLKESETRFRALSEAAFEGVAIHNKGKIMDANQAGLDIFGYAQSDISGLLLQDFLSPDSYGIAAKHMQEDYDQPYELVGLHKDGTMFPIEVQSKSIPYNDSQARVVSIRDLTVRKQLERQELELKLEQARVELLTTFFQNASHEFRTPLTIISLATHMLGRIDDPERHQQKLTEINEQVERINNLVNTLQLMVKLDTNIEMDVQPVHVNTLLKDVIGSHKSEIDKKCQQLQLNLEPGLPTISADSKLLTYAFKAIFENAQRYTDESGMIQVQTHLNSDHIHVHFQDNGVGMDEDALSRVFERFYRVDEAHTTAGFGVGLAIAKSIVERHQGTISAQSESGSGSTFTVKLPIPAQL